MTRDTRLRRLTVLLCFLSGAARADVFFERQNSVDESGRGYAVLMVLAEMTVADAKDFERHLKTIRKENLRLVDDSVWLKSVGGKRLAGFEIGRMIRRSHLATLVYEGDECDSACVWVLVGGVCRAAIGHVGLHRVVFPEPQYRRDLERDMAKRDQDLKPHLMEMDVPLELWTIAHNTLSWGGDVPQRHSQAHLWPVHHAACRAGAPYRSLCSANRGVQAGRLETVAYARTDTQ